MEDIRNKIIEMRGIKKRYFIGKPNELEVLHGIDLDVYDGEFLAIVGESGSGKSTLMNMIGVLDRPTEGTYHLDGMDVHVQPDGVLSHVRNQKIGFVFQTFNLIGRTTARGNVEMPMLYARTPSRQRVTRAKELLEMVGMADRAKHQPNELSGGQKQRVAIARAMACDPAIILADEPTGALDSQTGRMVMDLFHDLHKNHGKTIVLITHSHTLARETQRILTLQDGMIVNEERGDADTNGNYLPEGDAADTIATKVAPSFTKVYVPKGGTDAFDETQPQVPPAPTAEAPRTNSIRSEAEEILARYPDARTVLAQTPDESQNGPTDGEVSR